MSVHDANSELSKKIWNGDYLGEDGALARALAQYQHDHKRSPWASTLYSAIGRFGPYAKRADWRALKTVAWCLWHLRPIVSDWRWMGIESPREEIGALVSANECDVRASVLLFWSRVPLATGLNVAAAYKYAYSAYERTTFDVGGHACALVCLTLARIELKREKALTGRTHAAQVWLGRARQRVEDIVDANQKSRVYRGIAEVAIAVLGHTHDGTLIASKALTDADAVPGIGEDVRTKNRAMHEKLKV